METNPRVERKRERCPRCDREVPHPWEWGNVPARGLCLWQGSANCEAARERREAALSVLAGEIAAALRRAGFRVIPPGGDDNDDEREGV